MTFDTYADRLRGDRHVYVYKVRDDKVVFDRTVSRERYAIARVEELRERGIAAVYTDGTVIKGAYV